MSARDSKMKVNMHEAKTHLSRLVERVEKGEEITISRGGRPVARLVPLKQRFPIKWGTARGRIEILPGFHEADEEIAAEFERAIERSFPRASGDQNAGEGT